MTSDNQMKSILFLCTGNSCRSQMAEGWAKYFHSDKFRVYSAGIKAQGLNPNAVMVMNEAGVNISDQVSQTVDDVPWQDMDTIVTVCGHADETCPQVPARGKKLHHPFDDPPKLAQSCESDEDKLSIYRRVRDEIRDFVKDL